MGKHSANQATGTAGPCISRQGPSALAICRGRRDELTFGRRRFLAGAGAGALATQCDLLQFASSLFAAEPEPAAKPRVSVVFVRRLVGGGCTWPTGTTGQLQAMQELFSKTMTDAATQFGVELDIRPEPLKDAGACIEQLQQKPPDGLIIMAMELTQWPLVFQLVEKRGDLPTLVYSNVAGFVPHYKRVAQFPRTLMAATEDVGWLAEGVRMFKTLWRMKRMKLLQCPPPGYDEEFNKAAESNEIKAIADYYAGQAKAIVEPKPEQILLAAKHYVVLRRLMQAGGYDGVTVSGPLCTGAHGPDANPACVAVSKLLDEGVPAACENDVMAARCQMLTLSLFDRPGFMGNPSPNSVDNTFIVSHCTSALKLKGTGEPYEAPFVLRNFHAMGGVCPMVAWPIGNEATIMDFLNENSMILGTVRVVANTEKIAQPPCGGCRTSVEFAVDGVANTLDIEAGHHKWCVLGNYGRKIRNFCKLAGIQVADLTGKPLA
jgi:hypothetical protein